MSLLMLRSHGQPSRQSRTTQSRKGDSDNYKEEEKEMKEVSDWRIRQCPCQPASTLVLQQQQQQQCGKLG
jgi:hypothetical protein